MKNVKIVNIIFLVIAVNFQMMPQEEKADLLSKIEGFSHPESVIHDEAQNVLYVSNIGKEEPGDGFISRVSVEGEILQKKWIQGLNDPKGLLLLNDTLFVSDNTDLVIMDPGTASVIERVPVEDASFLNDITADEDDNIYISDSGKSSIYKRNFSGEITEWLITEELEFPNGLLAVGNKIYVAAWGGEGDGNVLRVDMNNQAIEKISHRGIGNLDGIQQVKDGGFYISDWASGKIYRIGEDGEQEEILTAEQSVGDILFLEQRDLLILPMNHQNEVWWYQLN